jgi:hypothetical protein
MTSTSDSERHTEFGIIIQVGEKCWRPDVRLIGVVNDMSKASVKNSRMKSKDGFGWWRILQEANA